MRVNPYIFFNGNCEEAMNFYAAALNVRVTDVSRFGESPVDSTAEEKNLIMHARLQMGTDQVIMLCDTGSRKRDIGTNVQLSIEFDSEEEMNIKFEKLAESGKINMPVQDTFWGAKFGMLTDKFGIGWMFSHQLKNN